MPLVHEAHGDCCRPEAKSAWERVHLRGVRDERGKEVKKIGERLGDLSDLPEALRKQLKVGKMYDLEEKIIKTMSQRYDGMATIDEIIVGLFRDFEYLTEDRKSLANKLYRMARAGHVESVPNSKGAWKVIGLVVRVIEDETFLLDDEAARKQ